MSWHRAVFATLLVAFGVSAGALAATSVAPESSIGSVPLDTLESQAATGNATAEYALGQRLAESKIPADRAKAMTWYRKAATQGNSAAEWALGFIYAAGDASAGVPQDVTTGLGWMRKSLSHASAHDMAVYGYLLAATGFKNGNKRDMQDGVAWIRRGAKGGSVQGMNVLGMLLLTGTMDVPPDKVAAEHWLLKSAKLGSALSQETLGELYAFGALGRPDVKAGLHWLSAAAKRGDGQAAGVLAYFLISGKNGSRKDPAEGMKWARKAIAKRDATGYYALGIAYQHGEGVALDPAKAWYNFAVAKRIDTKQQLEHVDEHLSQVATKLSATQLGELGAEVSKVPVPNKQQQNEWLQLAAGAK